MNYKHPEEHISIGVIDNDIEGRLGGTLLWVTHTMHVRVTDTEENFISRSLEAFRLVKSNLIQTRIE